MSIERDGAPGVWRLLDTEPERGAVNMAIDEVLMESVRRGGAPTLRFYRWSPPCLSLGRNQPAAGLYDLNLLKEAGIDVVRRLTGGRAVLHDDELTYAVVCSDRELGSPRAAYRWINEVLVEGLKRLGVAASIQNPLSEKSPPPSVVPCFALPVAGEVLAGGRKLVGSAQVRIGGVLLQHGSIPLRMGIGTAALGGSLDAIGGGEPAYLEDVLGSLPPWEDIVAALRAAWGARVGKLDPWSLDPAEKVLGNALAERYRDREWTWRR